MSKEVSQDRILQDFVVFANSQGLEFEITLICGGILIGGRVISAKSYFDEVESKFRDPGHEVSNALADLFADDSKDAGESSDESEPNFIHLRDVKLSVPGGAIVPNNSTMWRGRISRVDGFILGTLS